MKPVPKPVILYDPPYRTWVRFQPCLVCIPGQQSTKTECAHRKTRRHGDGDGLLALCEAHHRTGRQSFHAGEKSFAATFHLDLEVESAKLRSRYDREMGW